MNDDANDNNDEGYRINNNNMATNKPFTFKNNKNNINYTKWLKHIKRRSRCPTETSQHFSEISLFKAWFIWPNNCVLSELTRTPRKYGSTRVLLTTTLTAIFEITETKPYIIIEDLSTKDSIKF